MIKKFDNNFYLNENNGKLKFFCDGIPKDKEFSITSIISFLKKQEIKTCNVQCGEVHLELNENSDVDEVVQILNEIENNFKF